jgi:hypothetical protein
LLVKILDLKEVTQWEAEFLFPPSTEYPGDFLVLLISEDRGESKDCS